MILLLWSLTIRLPAQNYQATLYHYGVENGLSHREVEAVFQDHDGFMWLGTRFGLNRFDGYTFTSWTHPRRGLHFNDISRIFQDDAGWLWLFNGDQTFVFLHARTAEVRTAEEYLGTSLPFPTSSDGWQYDPGSPVADAAGRLHFITHGPDLEYTYRSLEGFQQRPLAGSNPFAPTPRPPTFYNPVRQSTWELRPEGWCIFGADHRLQLTLLRTGQPADLFTPNCTYVDRQGRVWLGGDYGVTLVDVQPVYFQRYFHFSSPQEKPFNNSTRGIWADQKSIYANFEMGGWVKMAREPARASPPWTLLNRTLDVPDRLSPGLYGYWGRPLLHDPDGSFWIGADHSLRHLDSTGRLLERFTFENDALAVDFWSIYPDRTGRLWLGYAKGLAYKDPADRYIRRLEGLPGMDTFPSTLVLNLVEDRENQLWLCTNRGLYALNRADNTAVRYSSRDTGRYWLPATDFQHLYQDRQGIYWLATAGNGLLRWDRRSGQVQRITQAEGLSSDNIYAVYEDAAQQLWLSSDDGIMQVEKSSLHVRIYLPKDGLAQEEFNRIAHFQAADGTIFLGGLNGITAFNPQDFYLADPTAVAAPLRITRFQQFHRPSGLVDRTGELWQQPVITVEPGDEFFQLDFALLDFENVENIRYAWKTDGLDTAWHYQPERSIRLSGLPFGTHTLRIKAQLANGQPAANELVFTVVVVRPFYRSIWCWMLLSVLAGWGLYRWHYGRRPLGQQRQPTLAAAPPAAEADQPAALREALPDPPPVVQPATSVADQQWLERLDYTIRQHLADPQFNTEFVAEKMALSRRQLQRRLQQLAGLSPHAYIQEIRLQEARQLLETRAYASVKEVAAAVGYANSEYFSRHFRLRFGKLPSHHLY